MLLAMALVSLATQSDSATFTLEWIQICIQLASIACASGLAYVELSLLASHVAQ
jgi:hypothetical protein